MKTKLINYIIEIIIGSVLFITWIIIFWLWVAYTLMSPMDTGAAAALPLIQNIFLHINELILPLVIGYLTHSTLSKKRSEKK